MVDQILSTLKINEFIFHLRATEELRFNQFASATLRGAFGNTLKSTLCIHSRIPNSCEKCLIRKTCAYYYLFETGTDSQGENNPHPFVLFLSPELSGKIIQAGEIFTFTLILIGKGLEYLPHIIYALENLGQKGLGGKHSKFDLIEIKTIRNDNEETIYSESEKQLQIKAQNYSFYRDISNKPVSQIKITLLTPLRLKHEGKLVTEIDFKVFVISLLRRILKIAEIHCEEILNIDWAGLLKISEDAKIIADNTYWKEYKRYSGRQKQQMLLGGLSGNFTVQGQLDELIQYLKLGELIHLGKSTSFGFGKYEMQIIERENQYDK